MKHVEKIKKNVQ